MPGGSTVLGYATFAAVKAAGYTGAAYVLGRRYGYSWPASKHALVGLARTGIGILVGVGYGATFAVASQALRAGNEAFPVFFLLLFPIRMAEWYLLLWLFFDRARQQPDRMWKWSAVGTVWSYVLDVVALAASLVIPGGMWIC